MECLSSSGLAYRSDESRRVADDRRSRRYVARHHAAGADHRLITDGYAGKDDRAAADPRMFADPHRAAEF
jgi:hypothetical protein